MIKILHYGINSHLGGIETYLYKLYTNIDRNKFQFDFLKIGNEKVYFQEEFTSMGSKFYSITPRNVNPLKNRRELLNLFKTEKFDIVHCHMNSLSYSLPIYLGLKTGNNVIVHSRNAKSPNSLLVKLLHTINYHLLPKRKIKMLAVSDLAGKWMFGSNTDFIVLNNGVNVKKFKFNEENRIDIRNALGVVNNYCIIHVGAFREQKNHLFILEVFNEFVKLKSNSKLLLVGEGHLRHEIERRAKNLGIYQKILWLGNRTNINELLSAADAFLFPSLYEGFPNAVLEAQTSGLPCLISDTITNEVIINNNCQSLSLDKTPREWANKLLTIPIYKDRLEGAFNVKVSGLSVEDEIKKIEDIYISSI